MTFPPDPLQAFKMALCQRVYGSVAGSPVWFLAALDELAALAGRPAVPLPAMRWACGASASGFDLPSACPVHGASCDAVCEHGTALDVQLLNRMMDEGLDK